MSRKLVYKAIEFDRPERAPRDLWVLPWAERRYPAELQSIKRMYPSDIKSASGFCRESSAVKGERYDIGTFIDAWGCVFENIKEGVHGEIKDPVVKGDDWEDIDKIHVPYEWFEIDVEGVNAYCSDNDFFTLAGFCARPFERLQFIRGTERLYIDLALRNGGMIDFMKKLHGFNCDLMERWACTDVDALFMMDDWGAQNNLLINPDTWIELFKPMYRDYCEIARSHGKKIFMHSDGNILKIYPHLIEIGVDALNSQIFCIGIENLGQFAGKIAFWGEMDRQHMLVDKTPGEIDSAVRRIKEMLWKDGGCIAQCEFGPGGRPENVMQVFESWDSVSKE